MFHVEQKKNFATQEYKYASVAEMMSHIATMGAAGYTLIFSSHLSLSCVYTKNL